MRVVQAMKRAFATVRPNVTVARATELAQQNKAQFLVVDNGENVMGFVRASRLTEAFPDDPISVLAEPRPQCVSPGADVRDARSAMLQLGVSALPVFDDGQLVGVVTAETLRSVGVFPNERGIDRCAACGASNDLRHERGSDIVFCRECIEQVRSPGARPYYFTLGGGD